jgi:hypothetical protein
VKAAEKLLNAPAPKEEEYCSILKYQCRNLLRKKDRRIASGKKNPSAAERGFFGFQSASVMVMKASAPQKIRMDDQ